MTRREIALLAFKLLGLWLGVSGLIGVANVPYFFEPQFESMRRTAVFFALLPSLVSLVAGIQAWFSADWLALRAFPGPPEPSGSDRFPAEALFSLAIAVIGVYLIVGSIPAVVNGIALFAISRQSQSTVLGSVGYSDDQRALIWSAAAKANAVSSVVGLLLGVGCLLGPARLAAVGSAIRRDLRGSLVEEQDSRDDSSGDKRGV
jgi:hypothetical protein